MPVAAGARLGPYEVVGLLGAGGMGEVYRARDTRLGRDVAIKVLPAEYAQAPDRLRRFEQEARLAGSLSHPNVLTLYDVGSHEGAPYLVTELLEGRSLRDLLDRGPLGVRKAVECAQQVARGLAAAHAKGIVHRDLKPENLFVTRDGAVKILDFGLAKLTQAERGLEGSQRSTTTAEGQVVGTVGYMAPEQVRGQPADTRSDIFALGAVLYEMLSGRRAFRGDTAIDTLTAILTREPEELSRPGLSVPPGLERIVRRCLEKDPGQRFQGAHDLALALEGIVQAPAGASLGEVEERSPYPGLASFTERDAGVFFGREAEVRALWQRLRDRKLLAVIGPSGSGKTSFLRAGVIPARPEGWGAVWATPGASPALGLARALTPELAGDAEAIGEMLAGVSELGQQGEGGRLVAAVRRWRAQHAEVLLVLDQFEELFTLCPKEAQERFATLIGRIASETDVHVVLSLRDDFLIRCSEHEPLLAVFSEITPLTALTAEGLRRALVEPAKKSDYRLEDGLVDEMVSAVEGARGALPLLAFAVAHLWEKRDPEKRLLIRSAYEEIGGVAGALGQHAEATMERIGAERQGMVREIFRNLVTAQGTRAAIDREELLSALPDKTAAEEVLGQLIDARLLTSYEIEGVEGQPSHHRVEVVHESLLKAWPRLVRWQAQDEEGALLRDQLRQAAHLWDEKGRTSDLLWTGTAYREFELWRERYPGTLTAVEEDFARAMRDRAQRKKRFVRAAAVAAVLVSTAVAIAIAVSRHQALQERERAEKEARRAEASKLVALGRLELESDPTATLAYARKSLEVHDTAEARRLAVEALWRGPVASVVPMRGEGCIWVWPSPDGKWLACSNWGSVITLFSADGQVTRALVKNRDAARPRVVLFSDDSRRLATFAEGDPEAVVWSVDGQEVARVRPGGYPRRFVGDDLLLEREQRERQKTVEYQARRIGSPEVREIGARPDPGDVDLPRGRLVYAKDRSVLLRSLGPGTSPRREVRIGEHDRGLAGVRVHDETGWVISFDEKREVRIWDPETRRLLHTVQGLDPDRLFDLPVLDAHGRQLVWQSLRQRAYALWDLAGPPDAEPLLMHKSEVTGEAGGGTFLADGRWLVTALGDRAAFWPLSTPWPRIIGRTETGAAAVVFTPDSRQVVSCGTTATRAYPLVSEAPPAHPVGPNGGSFACYGIAMEPGGSRVLLAATAWGLFLAPLDGGEPQMLLRVPPTESIQPVAFDAVGRWVATAAVYSPELKDRLLHVIDRRTGATRAFPLPGAKAEPAWSGGVFGLRFASDGRLMTSSDSGLRRWDPETGANEVLNATPCLAMGASTDGRRIAVACKPAGPGNAAERTKDDDPMKPPFDLLLFDVSTGARRRIDSHGTDIQAVALSPPGDVIATADLAGAIRVGRVEGDEPHLLVGATGATNSLAFSADGRWLASASGSEIRLWPMPDLTTPPLHTLPREELIAKLGSLTNVRVVEGKAAPSGYKLDLAPFPGWKDVPTW